MRNPKCEGAEKNQSDTNPSQAVRFSEASKQFKKWLNLPLYGQNVQKSDF
jgi:hypothetical protein